MHKSRVIKFLSFFFEWSVWKRLLPVREHVDLTKLLMFATKSWKLLASKTSSSLSTIKRSSSGLTPLPTPKTNNWTPAFLKGLETSLRSLVSASCVCSPSVITITIWCTSLRADGKTYLLATSSALSIRVLPLSCGRRSTALYNYKRNNKAPC